LHLRKTKIVATLGPSTSSQEMLARMIEAGVDVIRFNFSHGSAQQYIEAAKLIREISKARQCSVGILCDLQGPKIRIGQFEHGSIQLDKGDQFILDAKCQIGNQTRVGLDYKSLPKEVGQGVLLLLDDGRITMRVDQVKAAEIYCTVMTGGLLSNNKGINKQGGGLAAESLTDKDREDIKTAVAIGADFLAISFPRSAADIHLARQLLIKAGGHAHIVAKIERAEAIEMLEEIIEASDVVMVARGDLAIEVGNAAVPALQKGMIALALEADKFTITATQMMESMIHAPVPTRAEVSDVANAVLDGTDAVMLSAESAAGMYPVQTIKAMAEICVEAEKSNRVKLDTDFLDQTFTRIDQTIALGALFTAHHLNANAIAALTDSGSTAIWMSRHNIHVPIFALTSNIATQRALSTYRNVTPIGLDCSKDRDTALQEVEACLKKSGAVKQGDTVIFTSGEPMGEPGGTNTLKIIHVK
jgi:pyruvate kinase